MAQRTDEAKPTGSRGYVPNIYTGTDSTGLSTRDASAPFVLMHHAKWWTIMDGRLVPELRPLPLVAGVQHVAFAKNGGLRMSYTEADLKDRQISIIHPGTDPNASYIQEIDVIPSGSREPAIAYITRWETAHAGQAKTTWDYAAYADWLENLVKTGVIAPITPVRAAAMIEETQRLLSRAEHRLRQGQTSDSTRVEQLKAELEILKTATATILKTPAKSGRKHVLQMEAE